MEEGKATKGVIYNWRIAVGRHVVKLGRFILPADRRRGMDAAFGLIIKLWEIRGEGGLVNLISELEEEQREKSRPLPRVTEEVGRVEWDDGFMDQDVPSKSRWN